MSGVNRNGVLMVLDWGTTNVRAALLDKDGTPLDEKRGESGVGELSTGQFAARFDELTQGWPEVPAIAAGMIGSRQGWHEADYLACPASPANLSSALHQFAHGDRSISIVPGLKLDDGIRFDVMRGEESQLAGFLTSNANYSGTIVMPGTHSKWVNIRDGVISSFRTYMTGELFEAISEHTILRHSVSIQDAPDDTFASTAASLAAKSGSIEGQLFGLRARHLLGSGDEKELRQELSALLIMAEIRAGEQDGFVLSGETILIGTEGLTAFYETALAALGHKTKREKGTTLVWPALFAMAREAGLIEKVST